jgi:hypothetical protein
MLMVWIMFAILAISFMKEEMGYCQGVPDYYGITKSHCLSLGHTWGNWPWNFDNIGNAFVTLFVLSSLEGWPDIMATSFDAAPASDGPTYNGNIIFSGIFFISFIMIGSLFLMNLFVGVIFFQFQAEQEQEKKSKFKYITGGQMRWLQMNDIIRYAKPTFDLTAAPENPCR